jgi:hypothetical protein
MGCEDWPDEDQYKTCPACGEPAPRYSNLTPLSKEAAQSFLSNAAFEAYYEARCIERGVPTDGPLPCPS